jgi:hypothetical protein
VSLLSIYLWAIAALVGPVRDFDVAEAGVPTSDGEIAAGVVEGITVLNQHVERRRQTECVLLAGTVMFSWSLAGIGQLSDSRITPTFSRIDSRLRADK